MTEKLEKLLQSDNALEIFMASLGNIVLALLIFIIGSWIVSKLVNVIVRVMESRNIDAVLRNFLSALLKTVLKVAVIIIALEQLGVNTTSLLALLGVAGLAVGLAMKDSLSNFAAGVMLIMLKPFRVGDYVEAAGTGGIVEKISMFNTIMTTVDNKEIIIPNSFIYGGTITNYSARPIRRVDLLLGISYDDDIQKARELIMSVLADEPRLLEDRPPVIAVADLGESSVDLTIRVWVNSGDFFPVKWHLLETIKNTFDNNGITIPFPQRDVNLNQAA